MKRLKAEIDTLDRRSARRLRIFACAMRNERADLWVSSNNKTHWHEYKIKTYNIQNTSHRAADDAHDANDANSYTTNNMHARGIKHIKQTTKATFSTSIWICVFCLCSLVGKWGRQEGTLCAFGCASSSSSGTVRLEWSRSRRNGRQRRSRRWSLLGKKRCTHQCGGFSCMVDDDHTQHEIDARKIVTLRRVECFIFLVVYVNDSMNSNATIRLQYHFILKITVRSNTIHDDLDADCELHIKCMLYTFMCNNFLAHFHTHHTNTSQEGTRAAVWRELSTRVFGAWNNDMTVSVCLFAVLWLAAL